MGGWCVCLCECLLLRCRRRNVTVQALEPLPERSAQAALSECLPWGPYPPAKQPALNAHRRCGLWSAAAARPFPRAARWWWGGSRTVRAAASTRRRGPQGTSRPAGSRSMGRRWGCLKGGAEWAGDACSRCFCRAERGSHQRQGAFALQAVHLTAPAVPAGLLRPYR